METEEIQAELDKITFPEPKESEMVVNVPLYVPKVLFMDSIESFARANGWTDTIANPNKNEFLMNDFGIITEEPNPDYVEGETIPNPVGAIEHMALMIRQNLKRKFERHVQLEARKQADAQAKAQAEQIFG